MLDENETATRAPATPARVFLPLLACTVAIATAPLILAIDAPWVIAWSDSLLVLIVSAAALKCFAITRRLKGQERTSWALICLAYVSYALAQLGWSINELFFDRPNPIPSITDVGYLLAPPLLMVGIWLYRSKTPTLSEAIVQLGNAGILVAAIFLANCILLQHRLAALETPGLSELLIVYVVIAMAAFTFSLFNICFHMRGLRRRVMMPLLLALGSLALSDYVSVYEFASDAYDSGSYGNIGYYVTFAFGLWAAFEQDRLGTMPATESTTKAFDERARQWETLLSPLALIALMVVALTHQDALTMDLAPEAIGASLLFIASTLLRDWWSQRVESDLREEATKGSASLLESERLLLAKNEELAAANRELSKEMIARKNIEEELRHAQKMEAIGQLTGGVAHDFNNLLAVIVGNIDLLEQSLEPESPQRTYTQEAIAAANRGAALTNRLLTFSRKQALDPRPIGINTLLKSMTSLLERTLGATIELRFDLSEDVAACMIDRAQLENAILNLVINARDAMRDGGVIQIETSNVTLDSTETADRPNATAGSFVSIAVRDTGIGMSPQIQQRAFEPFFTTKDAGAGSGLGLSMVYGFANQSGGHVSIRSEEGSGTEIRLNIPRTNRQPDPIDDLHFGTTPLGQRESVLVVEDDESLRRVIASFLEDQNYQVVATRDGQEALVALEERGPFDLLLSDIILPGNASGPELAMEVTRRQPSVKIVLMTGYASDALEGEAAPRNYHNILHKPFSMGTLARMVRSTLNEKE